MKITKENIDEVRLPITHDKIFRIMLIVTYAVSSVFLVKNIITPNIMGLVSIALCIVALTIALTVMKKKKVDTTVKEHVISLGLVIVVFIISLNSGASYSDDFPLFLALLGMTGMYLEPKFTKTQLIAMDIALVLMAVINPDKAGDIKQYVLCLLIFTLAGYLFYLTINRGRAFIELSHYQTEEAETLLKTIREMGNVLQHDFESSSKSIEESTKGLKQGSAFITQEAGIVSESCSEVHNKIRTTEQHISDLNSQVKVFEEALSENKTNMAAMTAQLRDVSRIIGEADVVFQGMKHQMNEVAEIASKQADISFKTTLLSLNASVEAAHAGSTGAGFAVVASEMKELSENSDDFSIQVSTAISELLEQVECTAKQFADSTRAIAESGEKMDELQKSFVRLTAQFANLYRNIDEQNKNVTEVDVLFDDLKGKVVSMRSNSEDNQTAVKDIVKAMDAYRVNIGKVINNTRGI